jgi:hypothetical protein
MIMRPGLLVHQTSLILTFFWGGGILQKQSVWQLLLSCTQYTVHQCMQRDGAQLTDLIFKK